MTDTSNLTTPDRILDLALEKEKQAHDFYEQLAAKCHVDFIREMLETLQNEESKHMHLISEMKRRLDAGRDLT
jgi:rubrerythrin